MRNVRVMATILLVVAVGACGEGSEATTTTVSPTTTAAPATTEPVPTCSSTGTPAPGPVSGLPEAVAAKRQAIIDAAVACDLETLETLASEDFITSFGGGGFANLVEWEESGEGQLGTLLAILGMSHGTQEPEGLDPIYAWPRAFVYDSWDEIPQAELDELLAIYSPQELEQIAGFGSYAGWRTGIATDGEWLFFVAGD